MEMKLNEYQINKAMRLGKEEVCKQLREEEQDYIFIAFSNLSIWDETLKVTFTVVTAEGGVTTRTAKMTIENDDIINGGNN